MIDWLIVRFNKNLRSLAWLNIPDRVRFFRMSHLFRIRHKLAPRYLLPNFKSISDTHTHNTRGSSYNFCLSRDLSLSPKGFSFIAIKQWNELPNSLKSIENFRVFKRKLKQFLLNQYDWFLQISWTDLIHLWAYVLVFCVWFYSLYDQFYEMLWILLFEDPIGKKFSDFHRLSVDAGFYNFHTL